MKVAIAGAGKLGTALAETLLSGGNEVTVLDSNEERIQTVGQMLDVFTVAADAKQIDVLKDIRIGEHDLLISTTDNDEKNIVVCSFAKKLGCKSTVARVRAPEHVSQLDFIKENMDIDFIVNPDKACADEIFKFLTQEYALSGGKLSKDGVSVLEFKTESMPELIDKQVKDVSFPVEGILIAAISRQGKVIIPNGSTKILSGDTIYIIGLDKNISIAEKQVRATVSGKKISRVMIAGGGKTGYFLAQKLVEYGASVKIIEQDRVRCEYLSAELNKVLVINADATETSLLKDENLEGMDAFVSLTGFDEDNLLLSLFAKHCGVPKIVAKNSHRSYISLTEYLGDIMIINPLDICTTEILNRIRKDGVVLFSQVINGQAEFREIQVVDSMPITAHTLLELDIPEGVLFASVERDGSVFIPNGNTRIAAGDKVLILSLLSSTGALENLLSGASHTL